MTKDSIISADGRLERRLCGGRAFHAHPYSAKAPRYRPNVRRPYLQGQSEWMLVLSVVTHSPEKDATLDQMCQQTRQKPFSSHPCVHHDSHDSDNIRPDNESSAEEMHQVRSNACHLLPCRPRLRYKPSIDMAVNVGH